MFRKDQFGIVFNTIFAIAFAVALPVFVAYRNGNLSFEQFCMDFIPGFSIAFSIGTYIDLKGLGNGFARFCRVKNENGLLFHILRVVSITFVMAFLMSLLILFMNVGFSLGPVFFLAFLGSFVPNFLCALVVAFVTFAVGMPLTGALCTKAPRAMPQH